MKYKKYWNKSNIEIKKKAEFLKAHYFFTAALPKENGYFNLT